MKVVSKHNPVKHYQWGNTCDGWNLVDENSLSVKQEKMPAGTSETKHYHQYAQQFFYILTGTATFEVATELIEVNAGQGLHIPPTIKHKIINNTLQDLEFLLCSQPSTINDRINCE
jgi:mannose-6-phosphate isomerase-like protein (cupin superfamily)